MPAEKTAALVLRTYDYAETSQILHLFTRTEGRVHGIAKGARRLGGSFQGGADTLLLGEVQIYARRGSAELRTLGGFRATTHFPRIRERIPRFLQASHVAALLLAFTREEQPLPDLFELSVSTLLLLEVADDAQAEALGLAFEAMVLHVAGFAPELTRCVACGRAARNVGTARLSALRGGLLCRKCVGEDAGAPSVRGNVVEALARLGAGPLAAAMNLPQDRTLRRGLREALNAWTTTVLDRPLRTAAHL